MPPYRIFRHLIKTYHPYGVLKIVLNKNIEKCLKIFTGYLCFCPHLWVFTARDDGAVFHAAACNVMLYTRHRGSFWTFHLSSLGFQILPKNPVGT